jgi:hypothetical protein
MAGIDGIFVHTPTKTGLSAVIGGNAAGNRIEFTSGSADVQFELKGVTKKLPRITFLDNEADYKTAFNNLPIQDNGINAAKIIGNLGFVLMDRKEHVAMAVMGAKSMEVSFKNDNRNAASTPLIHNPEEKKDLLKDNEKLTSALDKINAAFTAAQEADFEPNVPLPNKEPNKKINR